MTTKIRQVTMIAYPDCIHYLYYHHKNGYTKFRELPYDHPKVVAIADLIADKLNLSPPPNTTVDFFPTILGRVGWHYVVWANDR